LSTGPPRRPSHSASSRRVWVWCRAAFPIFSLGVSCAMLPCCHACAGESGDVHAETLALLADFGVATEPFTDEVLACLPPTVCQPAASSLDHSAGAHHSHARLVASAR
jgi:hypothetical protein